MQQVAELSTHSKLTALETSSRVMLTYRHSRTRTAAALLSTFLFVAFLAELHGMLHTTKAAMAFGAFLFLIALTEGIGAIRMATVQLTTDQLVYRSQFRTRRLSRRDIANVTCIDRRRLREWNTPLVELHDGTKVWLSELSNPARHASAEDGSKGARRSLAQEKQAELIARIGTWLHTE